MKKLVNKQKILVLITTILCILIGVGVYAGIQSEVGTYVWDPSNSRWIKSTTSGATVVGNNTPADGYVNPTNGVNTVSFLMGWDNDIGVQRWTRLNTSWAYNGIPYTDMLGVGVFGAYAGDMGRVSAAPWISGADLALETTSAIGLSTASQGAGLPYYIMSDISRGDNLIGGVATVGLYGYDSAGGNWDRLHMDTAGSVYVNQGTLAYTTDSVSIDSTANSYANISSNTTTAVKATGGILAKIVINSTSTGATSAAAFYNIATAGCTGTPASGYVLTIGTAVVNTIYEFNLDMSNGICIVTTGGTAANFTALYR